MSKLISESKSPIYSTVINYQFDFTDNVFGCNKFVNNVFNTGKVKNSLTLRTLPSLRRTRLSFHYLGGTREVDAIPTSMKVMIITCPENWDRKAPSIGNLLAYVDCRGCGLNYVFFIRCLIQLKFCEVSRNSFLNRC